MDGPVVGEGSDGALAWGTEPPAQRPDDGDRLTDDGRRLLLACDLTDVFVAPDVPARRERNIRAKAGIPEWEQVHAFLDCTVFNSGKDGLAFGEAGIYYHHPFNNDGTEEVPAAPSFVSWRRIAAHQAGRHGGGSKGCQIGGYAYTFSGSGLAADDLVVLLNTIGATFDDVPAAAEAARSTPLPEQAAETSTLAATNANGNGGLEPGLTDTLAASTLLAILAVPVAVAAMWIAVPWGPTWTEPATVTEIDVDYTVGGPRAGGHWWVYVVTESGEELRLNSPPASGYAEVGQPVTALRSSWTDDLLRVEVDGQWYGDGQGLGAVVRLLLLAGCAAIGAVLVWGCIDTVRKHWTGLLSFPIVAAGAWIGMQLYPPFWRLVDVVLG